MDVFKNMKLVNNPLYGDFMIVSGEPPHEATVNKVGHHTNVIFPISYKLAAYDGNCANNKDHKIKGSKGAYLMLAAQRLGLLTWIKEVCSIQCKRTVEPVIISYTRHSAFLNETPVNASIASWWQNSIIGVSLDKCFVTCCLINSDILSLISEYFSGRS